MLIQTKAEPERASESSQIENKTQPASPKKPAPKKKPAKVKPESKKDFHPADFGLGATIYDEGVYFKVWAPHATKVYVTGNFNDWSERKNALQPDEGGYWGGNVPNAKSGDEYKYLIRNKRQKLFRNDPYARELTSSHGNCLVPDHSFDWEEDEFHLPPWHELIIYELHVGTFNAKELHKPGDLYGVIEKLPYLRDLGINAIKVMPVFEFPGGFSWGYNPAHPFALENKYGGPKALKELVKAAHRHGIAVILDVVYNHFGPDRLDLWRFDGWYENDGGGIYFYNDDRAQTPWGDTRPDYGRGEVRQYLLDNAMMWLDEYRLDGLRVDSVSHIRNKFGNANDPANDLAEGWSMLQWINEEVDRRFPWKIMIAEDPNGNEWITKTVGEGGAGFGMQWDNRFVHAVHDTAVTPEDADRDMERIAEVLRDNYNGDAFKRVIYSESHDEVANGGKRIPEEIDPGNATSFFSKKRSALAAAIVLTAPGVPMLFQGQEFLEDEWFDDKNPLDWSRTEHFNGLLDLYRHLIYLRRNWYNNTRGLQGHHVEVTHINQDEKIIAYHRFVEGGAGDSVVVIANFSNQGKEDYRIGFPLPGLWKMRLNSDWEGYDGDFNNHASFDTEAEGISHDGQPFSGLVSVGAYSFLIYSQDQV
jgi:1,4-alpha-glucan branching enzyme